MKDNSNITQELLETVEQYYNNNMPDHEREAFELRLEQDSQFKTVVEDIKNLILGIENQSLKEELDSFHKDIAQQHSSQNSGFFTLRKLAAAVVILLAVSGFWWFSTPQHERLYSSYFSPDPGLPTTMSNTSNFEFYDAMVNYKQGKYTQAIEKWQAITVKNDTTNYFIGVAHLANDDETQAIPYLEKSIENKAFPLANDAYYYLALAYLKKGNMEIAKQYLQKSTVKNGKLILSRLD